ncbi:MAG: hypothetical protein JST68_21485 [Bacteroidetes bacterium]|nr:hypothetical protein [Bacteroidota bacterium]
MKTLLKLACCVMPYAAIAQTYTLEINAPASVLHSVPKENIESALVIRGFSKSPNASSLTVQFSSDSLIIKESGVKEFVTEDTAHKTLYYVEALYTVRCDAKCYDAQKQLVYSAVYGTGQSKYRSSFMATREEANAYWENNKESLKESFITGVLSPALVSIGSKLNAKFGGQAAANTRYASAKN